MTETTNSDGLNDTHNILLFGSIAIAFDATAFVKLRDIIIKHDQNKWLVDTIEGLSGDLETILRELPFLRPARDLARAQLVDLIEAFTKVGSMRTAFPLPNTLLVPLGIINQLVQYVTFYQGSWNGNGRRDNNGTVTGNNTETLGLCTGLLSAFVASSTKTSEDFRSYGAAAIRLGMLAGLVVDHQDAVSSSGRSKSLSVAWNSTGAQEQMQAVVEGCDEAYISVFYDQNRVTVTAPETKISDLTQKLRVAGLNVTEIELYGAFHSSRNTEVLGKLAAFCNIAREFQLPDASALTMPMKCGDRNGALLENGPLHVHALRAILLEPPYWFETFDTALRGRKKRVHVVSFGHERSVPLSLVPEVEIRGSDSVLHTLEQTSPMTDRKHGRIWRESDIAVVGMACKVAGADDLDEFWGLLAKGESQHQDISDSSARFSFQDNDFRTSADANMDRKWFANLINGQDQFDHRFFKKSARESGQMDPQQRHILQVAYQAVAQSGYFGTDEAERSSKIGCYVGVCLGDYENNVGCHAANSFTATGNLQGFIAGKVSHFFGWTGPGLTIDTACSSSLVAVHQACQSILSGECEGALAGGSHIMTSSAWFQNLAAGSFLSPTGQCKPFDAKADGYCRGEGVGAVFLKKLSKAVADGDTILGVIAATAVQQNQNCTPVFVPNVPSLSGLFGTVTAKAKIKPSQISVVEAHGTGTPVGDPAEYDSIRQVLGGKNRTSENPLMVSSVKGLCGHLECTSGIISLIKILLMLNKGQIPPQASFNTINPSLNPRTSDHMFIPTRLLPWDSTFRAALINNYGASGSNASLIVTQAPIYAGSKKLGVGGPDHEIRYPFWLSGIDDNSVHRNVKALRKFLAASARNTSLANISFNLAHQNNRTLDQSLMFSASSVKELDQALLIFEKSQTNITSHTKFVHSTPKPTLILCFGGQISTHIGLDPRLYDSIAVLRKNLDEVDAVIQSQGCPSIFPGIFERTAILDTVRLQTMLFATQYACARSWIDCGVRPAALVGHSFGELTALCVSQTLSLADAVKMVIGRALLIRDNWVGDKGAMMALEGSVEDVERILRDANRKHGDKPASIACYNGPKSFTLAGSTKAIDVVTAELQFHTNKGMRSKRLDVTNAFHSALVDPLLDSLRHIGDGLTFAEKPIFPIEQAKNSVSTTQPTASFVSEHMRSPVYFYHALERLVQRFSSSPCIFLEAGTNSTITTMAARAINSSVSESKFKHTFLGVNIANCSDGWDKLTETTLSLWKAGLKVQHWSHHGLQRSLDPTIKPLLLPPYQFDPEARHWMELKAPPLKVIETVGTSEESKTVPEGFLKFMGFKDNTAQNEAIFCINTATEKYKKLLMGHMTIQTAPICPATIQIGFVIDAISSIRPQIRTSSEPQIQEVQYLSPVCFNASRTTCIEVKNHATEGREWRFEVFSTEAQSPSRIVHTTGRVVFSDNNDPSLKRQLAHFERLFPYERVVKLLGSSDVDEVLGNRSIYRIFSEIVDYGEEFRGLQKLVNSGNNSAGHVVRKTSHYETIPWFDAHLEDTFCQLGGLWINCMTDRSPSDVYLANGIEQWIRAPLAEGVITRPDEFHIFATNHRSSDRLSLTDVFVFDATNGNLVEVILGIAYIQISKISMQKLLTRLTEPAWLAKTIPIRGTSSVQQEDPQKLETLRTSPSSTLGGGEIVSPSVTGMNDRVLQEQKQTIPQNTVTSRVKIVMADLSGLEINEIHDDSELADLGIDSLAGMEMVHEIEATFNVKLPQGELMNIFNMRDLVRCVTDALGVSLEASDVSDYDKPSVTTSSDSVAATSKMSTPTNGSDAGKDDFDVLEPDLPFETVTEAFNETKKLSDQFIEDNDQANYVIDSLPLQNKLTVALTLEALEELGAGFRSANPGDRLHRVRHSQEHAIFVEHLYRMLETETQIIKIDSGAITRTAVPIPQQFSKDLYEQMLKRFPDQDPANKLIYYAGANLGRVLSGEMDGISLIFGSSQGRNLVSNFYGSWPLNIVLYGQMEDFLTRLARKLQQLGWFAEDRPLRILEMGAGTGGTTRRIAPLLARLQIPVEYTFTDLAPSFVAAARKTLGHQYPWMKFRVHDIEKPPPEDLSSTQHFVFASNAVHATHSLQESTTNIRKFLRHDGFLLMLEMTRTPYWVDLIFGLFAGWWLFDDGRRHALTHESRWQADLEAVGFGCVDWTDGDRPESKIEKLILAAAATSSSSLTGNTRQQDTLETTNFSPIKKELSLDARIREETVAEHVLSVTQGFRELFQSGCAPATDSTVSEKGSKLKCMLITGTTGGLGAHLVAETANREDVVRVVCLNRRNRNKKDPQERQLQALRKKGIVLGSTAWEKIEVLETDLSRPKLGLSNEVYQSILEKVTDIIHNAWLMHSKWPLRLFEPQLRIMGHMLELARDISVWRQNSQVVTFEFVSSIATIGHHPFVTSSPVVPEERVSIESVLPTGYGEAKYVCERMLDATLHKYPDRFRATAVRLGQIAGSSINGHWNSSEHISYMVKSSQTLRALPDLHGTMGWTPADTIARTLVDIITQPEQVVLYPIYHIENPIRQPWSQTIGVLADSLSIPRDATGIIPFDDWLERVKNWPRKEDNSPEGANPAYILVDFLADNFARMSCGGLLMGTARAREHSSTLASAEPVSEELLSMFVKSWRDLEFLV